MVKYKMYTEQIKNTKATSIEKKMTTNLDSQLEKIIARVKERVAREVPDTGYFRNFAENFEKGYKSDLYCKNIALFIQRDEMRDGRAFLGVSALHPAMNQHTSTYIMNGNREKILEYMNGEGFKTEFKETVLELVDALKKL